MSSQMLISVKFVDTKDLLCFHCNAIENKKRTSQYRKSRIREMKEDTSDKYTYSFAKNQVYAIIHMRDIRKNVLPGKLYKALYQRRHVGVPLRGTKLAARNLETDICF